MNKRLNINLRMENEYIKMLRNGVKKERAWFATWTLDPTLDYHLLREFKDVRVVVGQTEMDTTQLARFLKIPKHRIRKRRQHSKIWVVDDDVYVGSANMVRDGVGNIMCRVTAPGRKAKVETYFKNAWQYIDQPLKTLIL